MVLYSCLLDLVYLQISFRSVIFLPTFYCVFDEHLSYSQLLLTWRVICMALLKQLKENIYFFKFSRYSS